MELTLYKAHRADGKGEVEGDLITNPSTNISDCILLINGKPSPFIEIKPETLSIYTGLNAEWFNEGVDPRIWSGDLFEIEHSYSENTQLKVIYKNAAFYVQRLDDQEIEKLLFDFISDNVYKKIGSIHDEKEGK